MGDGLPHATEGRGHCRQGTSRPLRPIRGCFGPSRETYRSAIGIDATFPFGAEVKSAADVPVGQVCGPAVAERGHEFFEVASVPGWQDYNFPELTNRASGKPTPDAKS